MSRFNTHGFITLLRKEMLRFWRVKMQTIAAPILTAGLYLVVFRYAMGDRQVPGLEVPFLAFLVPGLAMMTMLQNAFANTSSSLITAKVMGTFYEMLCVPLAAAEILGALVLAAVVRAWLTGLALLLVLAPAAGLGLAHPLWALYFGTMGAALMGLLGVAAGIASRKFDDLAFYTNFVVLPLTFLSGVFYSIGQLPDVLRWFNMANPFFYLIDGFRYAFIGVGDSDPTASALGIAVGVAVTAVAVGALWRSGWRLQE
ncbi:MAG: metal-dependent hydrolase [Alphaproteobacteria bacterium CG_4_10_14_0_2_um_filter_63_37]|nr:MAG: metal-dependent hydrolase [Proteobacteria bacterium CG1_02_64_396]PJA23505.1 MAG: metal-dependent hydrolase [Alphaproteobacteria bacterium CG_4_10_14_0_2_um_filter_63_37]